MVFGGLPKPNILVIGDVMLDRYIKGSVSRISPEAPVPIVRVSDSSEFLGGAGNVAANLINLGCETSLLGVCGSDLAGEHLTSFLEEKKIKNYLFIDTTYSTTIKTRIIAQNQQLLRLDEERPQPLNLCIRNKFLSIIKEVIPQYHAVILSDYNKGIFQTTDILQNIIKLCLKENIPIFVDPKNKDWENYCKVKCITPNISELELALGNHIDRNNENEILIGANTLRKNFDIEWVLITRDSKGICLVGPENYSLFDSTKAREVYDVSGAGDTIISVLAFSIVLGFSFPEAAKLANSAAGIVVGKLGSQPITNNEFMGIVNKNILSDLFKTITLNDAKIQIQSWRSLGTKIVFTNGCFDILHPGHIHLLNTAKTLGDKLIVGINSDKLVRELKGLDRPIFNEYNRTVLLKSLSCVDMVIVFEEKTPLNLIETLKPDVLVKGADYKLEQVIGRDIVEKYGGKIVLVPILEGFSTSGLIKKIKN